MNVRVVIKFYQLLDQPIVEAVHPAMQSGFMTMFPGGLDDGGMRKSIDLFDNIQLDQAINFFCWSEAFQFVLMQTVNIFDVHQPVIGDDQIGFLRL